MGDSETFRVKGHLDTPYAVQGLSFLKDLITLAPPGATNFDYGKTSESFKN